MISTLEGLMGSSKSLTSVALLFMDFLENGRKIISNDHLKFPHIYMDLKHFVDHVADNEMSDSTILLDEGYLLMDSRTSSGKLNKLFTYFIAQTRKRNVDMYICTHHIDHVDKRLRRAVDIRGSCRYVKEEPCRKCAGSGDAKGPGQGVCRKCFGRGVLFTCLKEEPLTYEDWRIEVCDECKGLQIGNACDRCMGWGKTGWGTTRFFNRRRGKRSRLVIKGAAFWDLYSTEELVPFSKKQTRISVADL